MKKISITSIELSLSAEIELLHLIIKSPNKFINSADIMQALKSQSNFSKYSNPELGILPLSLNSHKLYIKRYSNFTFTQLDNLRLKAYNIFNQPNNMKKDVIKDLRNENNILKVNNLTLIKIIYDLKSLVKHMILKTNDQALINELNIKLLSIEKLLNHSSEISNEKK